MRIVKLVLATTVLFTIGVSVAGADIPEGDGTVYACYLKHAQSPLPKGNLRVIDYDLGGRCTSKEAIVFLQSGAGAISDRAAKINIQRVDDAQVLAMVSKLPISSWNYKQQTVRHIGPMAQDFDKLFGVGADSKHINLIDTSGVSLAAIKGLNGTVRTQQREIEGLAFALILTLGVLCFLVVRRRKPYKA